MASSNSARESPPTPKREFALTKYAPSSVDARTNGHDELKKIRHNSVIHKKTLSFINESIAFAPIGSEDLAQGYNDRSNLLHHLKLHDKAIIDIDRGLAYTTSKILKAKLLCRKASCLNYVDRTNFIRVAEEARICIEGLDDRLSEVKRDLRSSLGLTVQAFQKPPTTQLSKEIKISSDLELKEGDLEIKKNSRFGRHLLSSADVEPGEVIMVQDAYALCPQEDLIYMICSNCLDCAWNGIPCDNCPCVIYCSEDCKQKAWQKYHEVECPLLSVLLGDGHHSEQEPLILRIIATALQEETMERKISNLLRVYKEELQKNFAPQNFTSGKFSSICHLFSSHELFPSNVAHKYKNRAAKISGLFAPMLEAESNATAEDLKDLVLNLAGIVQANTLVYQGSKCFCETPDKTYVGHECQRMKLGMLLVANSCSLINHGCIFNVGWTMRNGKVIVFSTQPITEGSQLFFTYSPTILEERSKRQEYLQTIHWFICTCIPCVENWNSVPKILETQREIDTFSEWKKKQMAILNSDTEKYDDYVRILPELKKEIKKMFSDHTIFRAEVKSHHYQRFLYYVMALIYGTQIIIPATCHTQD